MAPNTVASAATTRPPFDRAAHCRRIGAHGGAVTVARHGTAHMRTIGTAGAHVTISRHGYAHFAGLVKAKGWHGRRLRSLAVDLAAGHVDAALAATAALALVATLVTGSPTAAQDAPDPRIAHTVAAQSLRFPAPDTCDVVGGWEDGSIVAACELGIWLAHGPDADDTWATYTGPLMPVWIERAMDARH